MPHDPRPPHWQSSPMPSHANGHSFELAMVMGELRAEARRHTEILLSMQERLIKLPDELVERLPEPPPPASTPAGPSLGSFKEWVVAATAVAALTAAIVGKLTWAEAFNFLRQAGGGP